MLCDKKRSAYSTFILRDATTNDRISSGSSEITIIGSPIAPIRSQTFDSGQSEKNTTFSCKWRSITSHEVSRSSKRQACAKGELGDRTCVMIRTACRVQYVKGDGVPNT